MGFGGGSAFGLDVGNLLPPDDLLQRASARLGVGAENHPIAMDWMGRGDDPFNDPFAGADELFDDWIKCDDEAEEDQAKPRLESTGMIIGNFSTICILTSQDATNVSSPLAACLPTPGLSGKEDEP